MVQMIRKEVTAFREEVQDTERLIRNCNEFSLAPVQASLRSMRQSLQPLSIVVSVRNLAAQEINVVWNGLKRLGSFVARPVVSIVENSKKVIGSIKGAYSSLSKMAPQIFPEINAKAAFDTTLGSAMTMEKQTSSIQQSIGMNNKNLSSEDLSKQTGDYVKWLRETAASKPIDFQETISAGTRAIQIAQGDTSLARSLTELAANMASQTEGKSIKDAMDALMAARGGEFKQLKDSFGINITEEDLKGLFGKNPKEMNSESAKDTGYRNLLGNLNSRYTNQGPPSTVSGMMGVMKSRVGVSLQGMGMKGIEAIKPEIQELYNLLSPERMKVFEQFGANAMGGLVGAIVKGVNILQSVWPSILPSLQTAWNGIQQVFDWIVQKIDSVGQRMPSFSSLWNSTWPIISNVLGTAWNTIQPVLGYLLDQIPAIQTLWSAAWPTISGVMETAWQIIAPALDIIWFAMQSVWEIFKMAWPFMVGIVRAAWTLLKPIFAIVTWGLGLISKGLGYIREHFFGFENILNAGKDKPNEEQSAAQDGAPQGPPGTGIPEPEQNKEAQQVIDSFKNTDIPKAPPVQPRSPYDSALTQNKDGQVPVNLQSTSGVLASNPTPVIERVPLNINIVIPKLADTVNAYSTADLERFMSTLEEKLRTAATNMATA